MNGQPKCLEAISLLNFENYLNVCILLIVFSPEAILSVIGLHGCFA